MKHSAVRLDGDVAIVTGAGNGLGRAHALALADRGAAVVCNDVVGSAAEATAHEIVQRGGKALPESSSVASPEGGATIVEAAIAAYGSVQIVVNNAGQLRTAPFDEMRIEDFDDVVRTHLAGAFYVTQPAYRHMKADGYGRIIFTSSNAGAFGIPWQANYTAAKAGVMGLCSVVALEGAAHGIRANAILPVALNTNMQNPSGHALFAPKDLEELGRVMKPLAPYATAENVAPLVVYLASRSCNLTREVLSVGGGHVSKVFIGVTPGWYAADMARSTPEDFAANLDVVSDLAGFATPQSVFDEFRVIAQHMPS